MQRLFNVSAKSAWDDWIEFCLKATVAQAQETVRRCERLLAIREQFTKRLSEVGGSVRLHQVVDGIFRSPYVRIAELPPRLNVTYPTAKADLDRLVNAGILRALEGVNPKTYYAPEVFAVAYEEVD